MTWWRLRSRGAGSAEKTPHPREEANAQVKPVREASSDGNRSNHSKEEHVHPSAAGQGQSPVSQAQKAACSEDSYRGRHLFLLGERSESVEDSVPQTQSATMSASRISEAKG
jgi:hypothetical protein